MKKIDTKQDKVAKFLTGIANMERGETIAPSTFARRHNLHPSYSEELNDILENAKQIGWETVRDMDGKAKQYIKTEDPLELRDEVRELKKSIIDIAKILDEIKTNIRNLLKKWKNSY